ncbi:50S ribosomal protein L15e [Candidatus Woesearchaeota archaeon]|nr:MAG: 50S ribosomal protein L15e [Candidatus Woesearchaeota archaeon]
MGVYKYIRNVWKRPKANMPELMRERLILWRREPATVRIHRPTRIDRARSLGYRAKQGIFVVRQRVIRGGRMREQVAGGRRPKANRRFKLLDMNYQRIAEQRAASKHKNAQVLNSYPVAKDGIYKWYEVILVDTAHPAIRKDPQLKWITSRKHKGRVYRGLTSAGRKSRGLRKKGKGSERVRRKRVPKKRRAKL